MKGKEIFEILSFPGVRHLYQEVIEGTWDHCLTPYPELHKTLRGTIAGWLFSSKRKLEEPSTSDGWGTHPRQVLFSS